MQQGFFSDDYVISKLRLQRMKQPTGILEIRSGESFCYFEVCKLWLRQCGQKAEGAYRRRALSRVAGQSGSVDPRRRSESWFGKLAQVLASKPESRGVVATLCNGLRKGRRPKRSIKFA